MRPYMKTIEEVKKLFADDRFATENGAVVEEIGDHYAKCSMRIEAKHKNAMGAVMGGVYFTLADFAFAVAANWQEIGTVSLNSTISYLGAARGEVLIAESHCVKSGRTTSYYVTDVRDDTGALVASVTTTGYRKSH